MTKRLLAIHGKRTVDDFHKALGKIMWSKCGMARNEQGLQEALRRSRRCARSSGSDVKVLGGEARSTSRSRRPAASPTSSSSAS
jgi:succinate dehydrogenase / fumarate reductase flavoprotein subunit